MKVQQNKKNLKNVRDFLKKIREYDGLTLKIAEYEG